MKKTLAGLAALVLTGCGTGPFIGEDVSRVNFAAGSALGASLSPAATSALYEAFIGAVGEGAGATKSWAGGGASGAVTPGGFKVANLKPDPRTLLPADPGLDLAYSYETELGLHALVSNANLRAGPSNAARIIEVLDGGTAVDVVGKTVGQPFYLIAVGGRVRGYVHESLAKKAPGTELDLAGGPVRRAHPCRDFEQSLTTFGRSDRWTGVACDRGEGWRLEPRSPAV
jgi:hypothetical protein